MACLCGAAHLERASGLAPCILLLMLVPAVLAGVQKNAGAYK